MKTKTFIHIVGPGTWPSGPSWIAYEVESPDYANKREDLPAESLPFESDEEVSDRIEVVGRLSQAFFRGVRKSADTVTGLFAPSRRKAA